MSQRRLTPTEQTIVRPLLEHRAALQRELQATERGLLACLHALHGEIDQSLSLDPQTMVLTTTEPKP
jgi:hypothetical protein